MLKLGRELHGWQYITFLFPYKLQRGRRFLRGGKKRDYYFPHTAVCFTWSKYLMVNFESLLNCKHLCNHRLFLRDEQKVCLTSKSNSNFCGLQTHSFYFFLFSINAYKKSLQENYQSANTIHCKLRIIFRQKNWYKAINRSFLFTLQASYLRTCQLKIKILRGIPRLFC